MANPIRSMNRRYRRALRPVAASRRARPDSWRAHEKNSEPCRTSADVRAAGVRSNMATLRQPAQTALGLADPDQGRRRARLPHGRLARPGKVAFLPAPG